MGADFKIDFRMNIVIYILLSLLIIFLIVFAYYISLKREENNGISIIEHGNDTYKFLEIQGILTKDECKKIMDIARSKKMERSNVWDYEGGKGNVLNESHRRSYQVWLNDRDDGLVERLSQLSEELTGIPKANQELLQVVRYEPGGMFNAHFDACTHEVKEYCDKMNRNSGQRRTTLLIYLTDDFEGGETEFVNIGVKIKPKAGSGILFWGTNDDGKVIEGSKHKGNEVKSGEKWICTIWSHEFPYNK